MNLSQMQDAERAAGQGPITKAVISVPAYFDDAQREATIAAGGGGSAWISALVINASVCCM